MTRSKERPAKQHTVRVSHELYELVRSQAESMRRSVGQQLEYLAGIGYTVATSHRISARQLNEWGQLARDAVAGTDVSEQDYGSAFEALSTMTDNSALQRRLAAEDRPAVGRDEETGELVEVAPDELCSDRTGS